MPRKKIKHPPLIASLVFVLASAVIALQVTPATARQSGAGPAAKEVFLRVCGTCHAPEQVTSTRRSRSQWEDSIEKMIERGAKGTDEEFTIVFEYLISEYGRVNVNTATPGEIAEVLGLSEKEAEAIVRYRQTKGKFDGFDALMKVPDLDREKLEKSREAISF